MADEVLFYAPFQKGKFLCQFDGAVLADQIKTELVHRKEDLFRRNHFRCDQKAYLTVANTAPIHSAGDVFFYKAVIVRDLTSPLCRKFRQNGRIIKGDVHDSVRPS